MSGLLPDRGGTPQVRAGRFFVVEDALPPQMVEELNGLVDRLYDYCVAKEGLKPGGRLNLLDFVGKDERFLELIDWPRTFPKVWDILGWNIQLYHSHLIVTPPHPEPAARQRLGGTRTADG